MKKQLSNRRLALQRIYADVIAAETTIVSDAFILKQLALLTTQVNAMAIDIENLERRANCQSCGLQLDIGDLDAKPEFMRNSWLLRRMPKRMVEWLYSRAADKGVEFDRLECKHCYGHGWNEQ